MICKMNVARQGSIKPAGVNRKTKMMNVSLQFIVHFEVLNGMPTAGELAFAIM